ncbi:MAG: toast rack family protein [Chloroflexota bacterium]
MIRRMIPVLLILTLALTACSFNISLPIFQEAGPTVVDDIALPVPSDADVVDLSLSFGAGTLKLHPGTDSLVSGTATYNLEDFKPVVTVNGSSVTLSQGEWRVEGIPDMSNLKNEWDLSLGNVPIDLNIQAGAYKAEYEFGGLSLTNLTVSDGAAEVELVFSEPNATEMTLLRYQTGASNVSLVGLGNANFTTLEFDSGAGNYTLDFSGELKRDASVYIETGVSNMTLVIPSGVPVQITMEGGLSNVSYGSGWDKNGSVYTQEGTGSQLTIVIEMGAGNLTITR